MGNRFIVGIGRGEHEYTYNGVKYIVSSHFAAKPTGTTIRNSIKDFITGDFAHLTANADIDKMNTEYVCSAAGEQRRNFKCSQNQN